MKRIEFLPLDTLFFRDGSPFNQGELQSNTTSVFPPPPQSLLGAVRAAWARAMGWDGKNGSDSNWSRCCTEKLGAGIQFADLVFRGPGLLKDARPLYPAPAHVLGAMADNDEAAHPLSTSILAPGTKARSTDLGLVALPEQVVGNPMEGQKSLAAEYWITAEGLHQALEGQCPRADQLIHRHMLWQTETRVGIFRDDNRTTPEQALYSPSHIRVEDGVRLFMEVEGLPDGLSDKIQGQPHPVGGESRSCWLTVSSQADSFFPASSAIRSTGEKARFIVIALTPLQPDTGHSPLSPGSKFFDLPGTIVTVCAPRPVMLGGWDSVNNAPLPLTPHIAPGTVIFMESDKHDAIPQLDAQRLGKSWRYGQIAIGNWPNQTRSHT